MQLLRPIGQNCDRGARASSDITYIPEAIKLGAEVRPNSTIFEITPEMMAELQGPITTMLMANKNFNRQMQSWWDVTELERRGCCYIPLKFTPSGAFELVRTGRKKSYVPCIRRGLGLFQ
ncbi:MAG: hypothetical protein CM1200mP39_15020 [Dehalococcoidia bacterium]|nr:MAG: hypothetical protein CM1200mP39_15020 [Dehalococcoidia bacterium]